MQYGDAGSAPLSRPVPLGGVALRFLNGVMDFMVKINGTNRPLDVVRSNARRAEGIRRSNEWRDEGNSEER
jgi:hypothetical protein